jgi:regulator of cell morphogenesis and NO signaling
MTDGVASRTEASVADLIRARPTLAGVFGRLGLDFCCHGDRTLTEACQASGLAVGDVVAAIEAADHGPQDGDPGWAGMGPAELADHIEAVHHRWLEVELPELQRLAAKVLSVHGERHPELLRVHALVDALTADLIPHMAKEDRVLFPAIRALAAGRTGFAFGSVANPIAVMNAEHETVGGILAELEAATGGYTAPEDGCASFRLLYQRLSTVETDTHLHVFKENSVLFPAAMELEACATAPGRDG